MFMVTMSGGAWRVAEEVLRVAALFFEAEDRAHRSERHAEVRSLLLAVSQADTVAAGIATKLNPTNGTMNPSARTGGDVRASSSEATANCRSKRTGFSLSDYRLLLESTCR